MYKRNAEVTQFFFVAFNPTTEPVHQMCLMFTQCSNTYLLLDNKYFFSFMDFYYTYFIIFYHDINCIYMYIFVHN